MRWLRRLALALGLALLAGLIGWLAYGPLGPLPGGPLFGEVVREAPDDWSFSDAHAEVQVEVRDGALPWSVTTWCISHAGQFYIAARNGGTKRWVAAVTARPEARVRIAGRIYPVRFERIDPVAESIPIGRLMLAKYLGIEADVVRPREAAAEGEPVAEMWAFRVTSR